MTLVLKNMQNAVRLTSRIIRKDVNILRRLMNLERYDMSLLFVTDEYIATLNSDYRQVHGPTDVLSFPALEITQAGMLPEHGQSDGDELCLGDIYLAPAYIRKECQRHGDDFHSVMMATVTHGLCHLTGLDHETEDDWHHMVEAERDVLSRNTASARGQVLNYFTTLTPHVLTNLSPSEMVDRKLTIIPHFEEFAQAMWGTHASIQILHQSSEK